MGQIAGKLTFAENATSSATLLWPGGRGSFMAKATWGGGSVKLQTLMPDLATWIDVKNDAGTAISLSADGMLLFDLPPGQVKAVIATATAVYAYAVGLHQ